MLSSVKEPQLGFGLTMRHQNVAAKPFLKWAGGKRKLLPVLSHYFPEEYNAYFEPFLGGGAVFFFLQPKQAVLSDDNEDLIELYQVVKERVEDLIIALKAHRNEKEYYYDVRAQDPASLTVVERAARLIYLNKTCYNGLYRVNRKGRFNVPFGKYKNPLICDEPGLRSASIALRHADILACDFQDAVSNAKAGDFIYFDPPYHPLSKTSSFTSYTAKKFDIAEQTRLAHVYQELDRRGCFLMLSNSNTPLIRELYAQYRIIEVQTHRAINSNGNGRGKITELLIINYEI